MTRKLALILAMTAILAAATPVLAQKAGPNGGLLGGSGKHQTELVVTASDLTVYLLEDGKLHDSKDASLRAVIQQGGKSTTVNFVPDGKKLVAKLPAPVDKGTIVVLTGKDHHGDLFNARYVIN
jgi:hypothetical protein